VRAGRARIEPTGSTLAGVFEIAASPWAPSGIARQAELHPGVAINVAVLAAGFGALALALLGCAVVAAVTTTRSAKGHRRDHRARRATAAREALSWAGFGPAAALGVGTVWARG